MKTKKPLYSALILLATFVLVSCGGDEETNSVSIQFISADPTTITLQGTGGAGLSETSKVQFKVKDPLGVALQGQIVNFSLSTSVGGISLNPQSAVSDINGLVNTIIQSGAVPTPVRVISSILGTNISTQSDQLAISSGIPDQDSATLAVEKHNPEGFSIVGTEVNITARLGDAFNNPVPAGTSVSFTVEGGSIDGNCNTDASGACSVVWRSQNPRPSGGDGTGIITLLMTALGQESFTDNNGNGIFDEGDSFDDIGEAYRDDNNNSQCDSNEFFEDLNNNSVCDGPDGLYNGNACKPGYSLCSEQKNVHVNASARMVMSTSFGEISLSENNILLNSSIDVSTGAVILRANIADLNGNSMPGGSTIEVTTGNGEIQNSAILPDSIPDNLIAPYSFSIVVGTDETSSNDGLLTIQVTSPNNHSTIYQISVSD